VIDIHCHILPGIDDGPSDIKESVEMAKIAALDGITKIVATPHIKDTLHPKSAIAKIIKVLNDNLDKTGIPIEIIQGADVNAMLDPSLLDGYTINDTGYILIEFPHSYLPKNSKDILFKMMIKGYNPIITHPERNLSVIKNPKLLFELLDTGLLVQITADSLTGYFGMDVKECAVYILEKGAVSFIASDAHSITERRPVLSEGLKVAEKIVGKGKAASMVTSNPMAVITGNPLNV
jgi:protein-tyrosine phosphatase